MLGLFDAFADRVSEQAREYAVLQDNVRQRAMSACLDPFQILQPSRATVQASNATDLDPPAPRRAARRDQPSVGAAGERPDLDFV